MVYLQINNSLIDTLKNTWSQKKKEYLVLYSYNVVNYSYVYTPVTNASQEKLYLLTLLNT